jgi:hypothetical protein
MKRFAEAEALAAECLTLRTKKNPQEWWLFQTKSQLGQAKSGLGKYPEAEPLLLEGQKELASRKERIPARFHRYIAVAGDSLVDLYDHWGKKTEAAAWRKKLGAERHEQRFVTGLGCEAACRDHGAAAEPAHAESAWGVRNCGNRRSAR